MIRVISISLIAVLGQCETEEGPAVAEGTLPSGLEHELQEVIFEPQGARIEVVRVVRLRYVQPALAGATPIAFETVEPDFQVLCDTEGLMQRENSAPNASEIVVSLASAPVPFGATAPDIVQFIDAFTVENGACVWGGL